MTASTPLRAVAPRTVRRAALLGSLLAALAAALAAPAPAGALVVGSVDASFANCGQATGLVPRDIARRQFSYGAGSALARQADGRLLAAGPAPRGMGVTRFNADGSRDTSFGQGGAAFVPVETTERFPLTRVEGIAVMPDGRIVAAGWLRTEAAGTEPGLVDRIVIARFNPDGTPDASFSGDGLVVETPPGTASAAADAIAPASDGGLIVAGAVDGDFAVVRYRADGTVDPGFGSGGVARVKTGTRPLGRAHAVSIGSDGRITAAGELHAETPPDQAFAVARLTAAGAPDTSFAGTGVVTETFDEASRATQLIGAGGAGVYAIGSTTDRWGDEEGGGTTRRAAVVRYLENGDRDDAFAGDGSVLDAFGQGLHATVEPAAATLDADGNLYVGAERGPIARYLPDGRRDRDFGLDGLLTIHGGTTGESLLALADGTLLVGGGTARQGRAPAGFEFGPAIMRLGISGDALARVRTQAPAVCFLRVRNPTLTHLLRRGRTARNGKLLVGAFLRSPTEGRARITATARAGGRTVELGSTTFAQRYAGSSAFEIRTRSAAYRLLRRARSVRITLTLQLKEQYAAPVTVTTTLRR